jgi:2-methylcitrate dehydratase PrpD
MNANELADELDKSRQESYTSEYLVGKTAAMLRKQQAEIEALKAKTLTDEEIMEVVEKIECTYDPMEIETSYDYEFRIAKAILRKAQEK